MRVAVRDIAVEGATAYDPAELRSLYADAIGAEVTLARLFEIAAAIETKYREDGYVLSRAIIPAQTVENGVFRIRVVEGFVSDVVIEGEPGPAEPLIRQYLGKLVGRRPVNLAEIERYLLLVNDIPGVTARSVPRAGAGEAGAVQLVVFVERKWYDAFAYADNRGSRFLGPWNAAAGGALNSFTRFGERTEAVLFTALDDKEQRVGQLSYEQALGGEGLRAGVRASYGEARPGSTLEPLDVEAESLLVTADLDYPLIRTRRLSLWLTGGFDFIESETDVTRAPFAEDNLRVLYGGARVEYRDDWKGVNRLEVGLRQGLDIFGATEDDDPNKSRLEGESAFTALSAEYARVQPVWDRLNVYARIGAQYSFDPLLAGEEFSLGGLTFGRGYDPAELLGDHGVGLNLELRYTLPAVDWLKEVELYAFYDAGKVWNEDRNAGSDSLMSAGGGVRVAVTDWLSTHLELAKPLTEGIRSRDGDKPLRVFLTLLTRF